MLIKPFGGGGLPKMASVTYAGNSVNPRNITGSLFQPDLVWLKDRTGTSWHQLHDSSRLASNALYSNDAAAEDDVPTAGYVSAFNADGFEVDAGSVSHTAVNLTGRNYVAWCFQKKAGFFDIVPYVGNSSGATTQTISHNLGVKPELIIVKSKDTGTYDWVVQHTSLGATKRIWLNLTSPENTSSGPWADTEPTATAFTVGTFAETNFLNDNFIAYLFASVPGFCKISSYSGTGASGNSVNCGFKPQYLLVKRSDGGSVGWNIYDAARHGDVNNDDILQANSSGAETVTGIYDIDFTSTGFTVNSTDATVNISGGTYIFMAIAGDILSI